MIVRTLCCRLWLPIAVLCLVVLICPLICWGQVEVHIDTIALDPRLREPDVPKMFFEETVLDFGILSVAKAEKRTLTVSFTNRGTAPLLIERCETSCGCTMVRFKKKPIQPGKNGKISITLDAALQEDLGIIGSVITIYYNTPQSFTRLHAHGEFVK